MPFQFCIFLYFPEYSNLPLNEQMRLLQGSWGEILTLSLIYRSQKSMNKQNMKSLAVETIGRTNSSNHQGNMSSHSRNTSQVG